MIWRLFRFLVFVAVLGLLGLVGYSYSGFMEPQSQDITLPVELDDS